MTPPFLHILSCLALLACTVLSSPLPWDPDTIPEGGVENPLAGSETGSSGKSTASMNLSQPAIIAISVIAAVVVVGGVTSGILFYLAKKRQWEMKAAIRRSARRVTQTLKSPGLKSPKMSFPKRPQAAKGVSQPSKSRDGNGRKLPALKIQTKEEYPMQLGKYSQFQDDRRHHAAKEASKFTRDDSSAKSSIGTKEEEAKQGKSKNFRSFLAFSKSDR